VPSSFTFLYGSLIHSDGLYFIVSLHNDKSLSNKVKFS